MMRKIVILMILAIFLIGCASGPTPPPAGFDPTVNPFIGEWSGRRPADDGNGWRIMEFNFTENQFTLIDSHDELQMGTYRFTNNRITFATQNSEWSWNIIEHSKYKIIFSGIRCRTCPSGFRMMVFIKPDHDSVFFDLLENEELLNNFLTNQEELTAIQGTWTVPREINRSGATYTFSGNEFRLVRRAQPTITGTFRIDNNMLVLINRNNNMIGFFIVEYKPNNTLLLHHIFNRGNNLVFGKFVK